MADNHTSQAVKNASECPYLTDEEYDAIMKKYRRMETALRRLKEAYPYASCQRKKCKCCTALKAAEDALSFDPLP